MCVAAIALGQSADWPLVLASNRDEFYERPTAALSQWQTEQGLTLVSGRDLRDGGTWLGFSGSRMALVTNVREGAADPSAKAARSRGELPLRWLGSQASVEAFYAALPLQDYGGFNLLVGDSQAGQWYYLSNRGPALQNGPLALAPGVYGLSNAALDTPWPKTLALKSALQQSLASPVDPAQTTERLLAALNHRAAAAPGDLPQNGVPLAWEKALSSVFIEQHAMGYGTRASTVALLSRDGAWAVTERGHPNPLAQEAPSLTAAAWTKTLRVSALS